MVANRLGLDLRPDRPEAQMALAAIASAMVPVIVPALTSAMAPQIESVETLE